MIRYVPALLALASCAPDGPPSVAEQTGGTKFKSRSKYPPVEAFIQPDDQERAQRRDPLDSPCSRTAVEDGVVWTSMIPTDKCVRMLPRQRFKGVWLNRFEGSAFSPNLVTWPTEEPRIWLNVERVNLRQQGYDDRAYVLEFEGRQTAYPSSYGPCCFEHEIIVDRVISATPLEDQEQI